MMTGFTIEVDEARLREINALLEGVPHGTERVLTRAINQVGVAARTRVVRRVAATVNLKPTELKRRNVTLRKANYRDLSALLRISGRRVPLSRWGARQTRRGVSYAIRRGGRQKVAGAFIPRQAGGAAGLSSGHVGAFVRKLGGQAPAPRGRRGSAESTMAAADAAGAVGRRVGRLPIVELYGPSVPAVVEGLPDMARAEMETRMADHLDRQVETQIGLVLERRGG